MVKGIEHFKTALKDYAEAYVLIGGAACSLWYTNHVPSFRATNDLDIVLILENLNDDFVSVLKLYLETCGYQQWEKHDLMRCGKPGKVMYRFINPKNLSAPAQIELLSRRGNVPTLDSQCTHAPVVTENGYTGLSCIVLEDDYYRFIKEEVQIYQDLPLLSIPALILLKIKAHLNLFSKYAENEVHGSDSGMSNIRKHRNDVFFMLMALDDATPRCLPESLSRDVNEFVRLYEESSPFWDGILSHLKSKYGKSIMRNISPSLLLQQLNDLFIL